MSVRQIRRGIHSVGSADERKRSELVSDRSLERRDGRVSVGISALPCTRCLHDSGYESGMAGAARCALREAAGSGGFIPSEWLFGPDGACSCSSFVAAWEWEELN